MDAYVELVEKLVAISPVTSEVFVEIAAKLDVCKGMRDLKTNLERSKASSTKVADAIPKLNGCHQKLSSWVHATLCPAMAEIVENFDKYVQEKVPIVFSCETSTLPPIYKTLHPCAIVPESTEQFKLACSLADVVGRCGGAILVLLVAGWLRLL